ncbi:hypothetical protein [Fusibacter sp. JL216-2]|uniref:hypothetical protein n=1 Tax=Fusibacter sp. JL216-2 TaxID=3071453 RepID=UPI003D349009
MKTRLFIGDDKGRRMYKAHGGTDKGTSIILPNAICRGYQIKDEDNPLKRNRIQNPPKVKLLDAMIVIDGNEQTKQRYHVGEYAIANNKGDLVNMSRGVHKYTPLQARYTSAIQFITHAYLAYELGHNDVLIHAESCVPLGESERAENEVVATQNKDFLKDYTEAIKGKSIEVRFLDPAFNGAIVKLEYQDQSFSTEGKNALLAEIYDADTMEANEAMEMILSQGGLIGLNLGSTTTDPAAINKDHDYISAAYFSIDDEGTTSIVDRMLEVLKVDYDYEPDPIYLDYLIRNGGSVYYNDVEINIRDLAVPLIEEVLISIRTKFINKARRRGFKYNELPAMILTGGFVQMIKETYSELMPFLKSLIPNCKIMISQHPLFREAEGCFIWSKLRYINQVEQEKAAYSSFAEGTS